MNPLTALGRLRGRSRAELAERAAQYLAARAERMGWRDTRELTVTDLNRRLKPRDQGGHSSLDDWFAHFTRGDSAPFLPGLEHRDDTVAALRAFAPDAEAPTLTRAERMLRGEFDLLGYRGLRYALPIDWQVDPVRGRRAPTGHWSRIPFLDDAICGDHKAIWEINRHQVLVALGQAYWYSGDERFAARACAWLHEWMDANPPKQGINWASSLEVAFRAYSWIWTLQMLKSSPSLDAALFARVIGHLTLSARHLERFLSTYFSPNTHLTGEGLGLYVLGMQLAPLADATRWRRHGLAILLNQLPRHVYPDGIYFEQATYYQRYTAEFYLQLFILAEAERDAIRERIRMPLIRTLEALQSVMRPDGTMPLLGDDDGGRLMFLDASDGNDLRGLLATAAVTLQRPDFAYGASGPRAELIWTLGAAGAAQWRGLSPMPPLIESRAFMHGGVLVMRDGWTPVASSMVIDAGPHGVFNCGHAHADALSFDLTVEGRATFVDPGTYTYTAPLADRDLFRSTAVHNALTVNDSSSSIMQGPFSWATIAHASIERWHSSPSLDFFEGSHDGYERPSVHAEVVRSIVFVKDGYWIIRDRVVSGRRFNAFATLQCAIGLEVREMLPGQFSVIDGTNALVHVHALGSSTTTSLDHGWVSPAYGARHKAPRIRVHISAAGASAFETVICKASLAAHVERRRGAASDIVEVRTQRFRDVLVFSDGGEHPECEGVSTDADVFWIRRDAESGVALECFATGATRLTVDGVTVDTLVMPGALAAHRTPTGWQRRPVGASSSSSAGASSLGDEGDGTAPFGAGGFLNSTT
ncbi:MAG: alginate lyase family protein [Gemmatimonadaceae bacterium]